VVGSSSFVSLFVYNHALWYLHLSCMSEKRMSVLCNYVNITFMVNNIDSIL